MWPERTIGKMLVNDVYRGIVRYKGTAYMTVPGIVTASEFLAANQALKARLRGPGRGGGRPSGALLKPVCGRCGAPMYKWAKRYRCAGVGPSDNSIQRKGCGNTILIEELDQEVLKEFLEYDELEILETRMPGVDHLDEMAAVQLAIRDLDVMAEDYDERHADLMAELRRGGGGAFRAVRRFHAELLQVSPVPYSVRGPRKLRHVPLLPRVVIRPTALGLAGLVCGLGLTGCAQFNKALGHQQAMVYFKSTATVQFRLKVRAGCDNLPHVKAMPIATSVPLASAVDIVTYDTTGAGVADIARLEVCVQKFGPQVVGVDVTDSSDDS